MLAYSTHPEMDVHEAGAFVHLGVLGAICFQDRPRRRSDLLDGKRQTHRVDSALFWR